MLSITCQCLNQIAVSHISRGQTIAVRFHIFNQIRQHFGSQTCIRRVISFISCTLNHLKEDGKCITSLTPCTILCCITIQEPFVKRYHYIVC